MFRVRQVGRGSIMNTCFSQAALPHTWSNQDECVAFLRSVLSWAGAIGYGGSRKGLDREIGWWCGFSLGAGGTHLVEIDMLVTADAITAVL